MVAGIRIKEPPAVRVVSLICSGIILSQAFQTKDNQLLAAAIVYPQTLLACRSKSKAYLHHTHAGLTDYRLQRTIFGTFLRPLDEQVNDITQTERHQRASKYVTK